MKDLMPVICLNFMRRGEGAVCFLVYGESQWKGVHSKHFNVFGGSGKNVSNKENYPGPPVTL